ncbi:MAG: polyprenyl synthetase family protein [Mogibacterium sp.]|nr:polyprenyl synthetase family protein [Mogibacterium sp.]
MRSLEEYKEIINQHLYDFLPTLPPHSSLLAEAMRYSLEVGGKRLRPSLLLASSEFAGYGIEAAMPYAAAVEYIHTYSLIHDDLPSMDNDDLRRGKPTNHKVYGEGMAVLAGGGLLSQAAEILTREPLKYKNEPSKLYTHIRASHEILSHAGASGMVAGQTADILSEQKDFNNEEAAGLVAYIEEHKTADLITAPVRAGLILAGSDESVIEDFTIYARKLGTAFQILDDILDIEGDELLMGKTLGKDIEQDKCNYARVHGMQAAKEKLHSLTEEAILSISKYEKTSFFTDLAYMLEERES